MSSTIIVGLRTDQEVAYLNLNRPSAPLTFRTVQASKSDEVVLRWAREGKRICYTIASSDFVAWQGLPDAYVTAADAIEVLRRPQVNSVFVHELVTFFASTNNWNWVAAAAGVDWPRLNQVIAEAKRLSKRVIWSEPAHGWEALMGNATARQNLLSARPAIVPMWASNFPTLMTKNAYDVIAAAKTLGQPHGESVQSWYFRDRTQVPTVQEAKNLCGLGRSGGATFFQVEGAYDDLTWGSQYMRGVYEFTQTL